MEKMILPCKHEERVTRQVEPTIHLLGHLDTLHPEVLLQHEIQPADFREGLVFRSAIESIRGTFIASSTSGREGLVRDVLDNLRARGKITSFQQTGTSYRYDFSIVMSSNSDYFIAIEVKGGEGNSINISERPIWCKEFVVWSHLDGAIVNQPAHGAHAVVNRLTNELVLRHKLVDVLLFKDILCGTRTRPCPKYPGNEERIGLETVPDIFLFPQSIPSIYNPEPPIHTLDTLELPKMVLDLFGVSTEDRPIHLWEVHVRIISLPKNKFQKEVKIVHHGQVIDLIKSRSWTVK